MNNEVNFLLYKYKLKELAEQLTLTIRTRSSVQGLPQKIGDVYCSILAYLEELGENPSGMPFVIYYNLNWFCYQGMEKAHK